MILPAFIQSVISSEHSIEAGAVAAIVLVGKIWDKVVGASVHKQNKGTLKTIGEGITEIKANVGILGDKVDRLDDRVGTLEVKRENDLERENDRLRTDLDRARSQYNPHPSRGALP